MADLSLYAWLVRRSFRKLGEKSPTFLGTLLTVNTVIKRIPLSQMKLDRVRMAISEIVRLRYQNFDPSKTLFKRVQVQTQTGCNLSCPFCPSNKKDIVLPTGRMSTSLFEKILTELSDLKFCGVIHLYLQNEPLLDSRLEQLIEIARQLCLKASIVIETNGTLLDSGRLYSLVDSGMDVIYVNDYNNKSKPLQSLQPQYAKHLIINRHRSWKEKLSNRAGNISTVNKQIFPVRVFCMRPFDQLYIGFDGKVLLCCQDWQFEEVMGDVSRSSLRKIWNNKKFEEARQMLFQNSRTNFICKKCDFQGWP